MPGIFGAISPNEGLRERLLAEWQTIWPDLKSQTDGVVLFGGHAHRGRLPFARREGVVQLVDGDTNIYHLLAERRLDSSTKLIGNVVELSAQSVKLSTDLSGAFPLYYCQTSEGFFFSSLLRPLRRTLALDLELEGVLEYTRGTFLLGNCSLVATVFRLQPGEQLSWDAQTGSIERHERSDLWASAALARSLPESVQESTALLRQAVSLPHGAKLAVMLSAGWDSRTLLAAHHSNGQDGLGYSHGDLESRELKLAERVAKRVGYQFHGEEIGASAFGLTRLQENFAKAEQLIFPHWNAAGRRLKELGLDTGSSGVYGEVLGGHYGRAMLEHGVAKILAVGSSLLRTGAANTRLGAQQRDEVNAYLLRDIDNRPWFVTEEAWKSLAPSNSRQSVERDIQRFVSRGVQSVEQLIEAYITEHRGAQYIAAQALNLRTEVDIALPFANPELLRFAAALPFSAKVHNRLNQAYLKRVSPELLQLPLSATFFPAAAPLLLQESGRLIRRAAEQASWRCHFASAGRIAAPRFSWVNYQFLRSGHELQDIVEDLRLPHWDKAGLLHRVQQLRQGEFHQHAHSTAEVVLKVYNVDLMSR